MARRYRAPSENGGLLIDPPFDAVPRLIEENRKKLDQDDVRIGGIPLRELRAQFPVTTLRRSVNDTPLILTGHQPELFHPGVWVKNFAAAGLADRIDGRAVHLIVDNDAVHSTALNVPHFDPDPARVRLGPIPFDQAGPDLPYERRPFL